jgi:hypothetical protein
LDALHLRKIDLADRVLIIDPCGYVGESTGREIDYPKPLASRSHSTTVSEGGWRISAEADARARIRDAAGRGGDILLPAGTRCHDQETTFGAQRLMYSDRSQIGRRH